MKRYAFIIFSLWLSCYTYAYKYTGLVFDKNTGIPLPFTHIYDQNGRLLALSNEKGHFSIENHENDSVRICASSIGYVDYYMAFARDINELLVALTPSNQELEMVVIEGSKSHININLPYTQSTIYAAKVEEKVSSSLIDILETVPGVYKKSEYHSPIVLRGLSGKRVLIMQDGNRRMGSTSAGFTGQTVNVYNLSRVEVIKGPASVKYGPGAIGGIINMVSRTSGEQQGLNGRILTTYGSNNNEYSVLGNINYSNQQHSLSVGGRFQNASNFRYGNKQLAINSFHRNIDVNTLYNVQLLPTLQVSVDGCVHIGGPWGRAKGYNGTEYVVQTADKDDNYHISVAANWNCGKLLDRIEVSLFYDKDKLKEVRSDYDIGSGKLSFQEIVNYDNYYTGWRLHSLFNLTKCVNLNIGSDGVLYSIKSPTTLTDYFKNYTINNRVSEKAGLVMGGLFLESEVKLLNEKLKLIIGIRGDLAKMNEGEVHDTLLNNGRNKHFEIMNANIGALYQIRNGVSLTFNVARASRMPDAKELFVESATTDGSVFGNTELKPEYGFNFDLGMKGVLGNFVFDVSMFSNFLHDFIVQKQWYGSSRKGVNYKFDNVDKSLIYGFEASMAYNKDGFFCERDLLNYSAFAVYTKGYEIKKEHRWFSKDKEPLNQIAPFNMRHEIIYRYRMRGKSSVYAGINLLWFSGRTEYAKTSYPTGSYCLLGCMMGIQKAFKSSKCKLAVNVTNLTNEIYKPFESLIYGMGRSIKLLVAIEFGASTPKHRANCINN